MMYIGEGICGYILIIYDNYKCVVYYFVYVWFRNIY